MHHLDDPQHQSNEPQPYRIRCVRGHSHASRWEAFECDLSHTERELWGAWRAARTDPPEAPGAEPGAKEDRPR